MKRAMQAVLVALVLAACGGAALPPRPQPERLPTGEALVAEFYHRLNEENLRGLMALLVEQPVLVEPFSAPEQPTTHAGYTEVARYFEALFRTRDDRVVPEYTEVAGAAATVGWSMSGTDGLGVSGVTRLELRGGQIARIEIQLRE